MTRPTTRFFVSPVVFATGWLFFTTGALFGDPPCDCGPSPCVEDEGSNWIFLPSYFTHDPETGQRVTQYSPMPPVYLPYDPTYRESGFHYTQEIMRGPNGSVEGFHMVQTWGDGYQIRPYGEWLFPYRAGATPYGPWGNPQGPWTLPFDSWQNPYGLGRLPNPPWPVWPWGSGPRPTPYGNMNGNMNGPSPQPGIGYGVPPAPMENGGENGYGED